MEVRVSVSLIMMINIRLYIAINELMGHNILFNPSTSEIVLVKQRGYIHVISYFALNKLVISIYLNLSLLLAKVCKHVWKNNSSVVIDICVSNQLTLVRK